MPSKQLLIKNGRVIDGSGAAAFRANILIEGDRIAAISRRDSLAAEDVIDAGGQVVCPGFVDIHSHADLYIHQPDHPRVLAPLVRQGITTLVAGNCGYGMAPIDPSRHLDSQQFYLEGVTSQSFESVITWNSMAEFLGVLEQRGVALNVGMLCPHGLIRLQAMGQRNAPADADEIARMARALSQALEEGAMGLSTGLQYFPGLSSETGELMALGRALALRDSRFTSHLRSYTTNTVDRAMEEVVEVARQNEIHVQLSHMFTVPWMGKMQRPFVELIKQCARHPEIANRLIPDRIISADMTRLLGTYDAHRRAGIRLGMDVMPTTTGFTHMLAFFPPWVLADSRDAIVRRLKDPGSRRRIIRDIEEGAPTWPHRGDDTWSINFFRLFGYGCATIMAVASERNRHLQGRRLVDIAEERRQHPIEAACDLLLEEERQILVFGAVDRPEDRFTLRSQFPALRHPDVAVATDTIMLGFGQPSYLFAGCYPRFLGEMVREQRLLDLSTGIRKCTSVPARALGITHRGLLARGYFADVVIFDPDEISTPGSFEQPDLPPRGIAHVIINGRPVIRAGRYDPDALAGQVLRGTD